jgi:GntR family transcriptional regulator, gluconate operon transcriptional repressor
VNEPEVTIPGLRRRSTNGGKLARSLYSGAILTELREAIVGGRLSKGTRLVEDRLARDFGVSRGPIRSALHVLEAEGLVSAQSSGGMVVAGFGHDDLADLFRVRRQIELAAVRRGVELRSDPAPVVRALGELVAVGREGAEFVALDVAFHRALVEFGRSRFLLQAWNSLAPVLEAAITIGHQAASGKFAAASRRHIVKSHVPIADAIAAYDEARAVALLEEQYTEAEEILRPRYEERAT